MRRNDRAVTDMAVLETWIHRARVCRLGFADPGGGVPWILPLSFGYEKGTLYFHAAVQGKKVHLLETAARVAFEIDLDVAIESGSAPCQWTLYYKSIMGTGIPRIIRNESEKAAALNCIVQHYGGRAGTYTPKALDGVLVFGVWIDSMTGKTAQPPADKPSA